MLGLRAIITLAVLVTVASPMSAATITVTLTEFDPIPTYAASDPGAVYVGTIEVPTYDPANESVVRYAITEFNFTLPDRFGNDFTWNPSPDDSVPILDRLALSVVDGPEAIGFMETNADGDPFRIVGEREDGTPTSGPFADYLGIANPLSTAADPPGTTSHFLSFESFGSGGGTWLMSDFFVNDSGGLSTGGILRAGTYSLSIEETNPVPEPSSLALLGLGTVGLFAARRRRRGDEA